MKKIAFLGDVVTTNYSKSEKTLFDKFNQFLIQNEIKTCLNLESPIVEAEMIRIKNKITLKSSVDDICLLDKLEPFLVNLSNNHINDYGNESCFLTRKRLEDKKIPFFGVGYSNNRENIFVDDEYKIVYLSYTTRSADFTMSRLFAEEDFIGPYDVDLEEVSNIKRRFNGYALIVNVHWGIEDFFYPELDKITLGQSIIDAGADLIIGHHPHIIQPYQIYKGKYIFYSIGNFFFPEVTFELDGESLKAKLLKHQRKGIVPVFYLKNRKIELDEILLVENKQEGFTFKRHHRLNELENLKIVNYIKFNVFFIPHIIFRYLKKGIQNPSLIIKKLKKLL